tara:strand:+ start:295 stop:1107 length:813 start_codon:yes stop_codon:yes gene_type:complete
MAYLQLQDIVLHYEETGSGQPLLLIAGLGGDLQSWTQHVSDFSKTHRVIAFDNRGSGQTSAPDRPYTIAQMANDALKLLDHLEIPATHVLSFSLLGGAIALQLALEDPTRTERLAMIAPGGTPDNASVSILKTWIAAKRSNMSKEALIRLTSSFLYSRTFLNDEELFESMIDTTSSNEFEQLDHAFIRQAEAILNWQLPNDLSTVSNPVLLLNGLEDQLVTPGQINKLTESLPNCNNKQLEGGHAGLFESPEIYRASIREFFEEPSVKES